jgi:hypothetical protein
MAGEQERRATAEKSTQYGLVTNKPNVTSPCCQSQGPRDVEHLDHHSAEMPVDLERERLTSRSIEPGSECPLQVLHRHAAVPAIQSRDDRSERIGEPVTFADREHLREAHKRSDREVGQPVDESRSGFARHGFDLPW